MRSKVIRWRGERARLGTWRGGDATAYLSPFPEAPALTAEFLERSLDEIRSRGFRSVVTGALTAAESLGFIDAGFKLHEELHLLEHTLETLPESTVPTRRARRADRSGVLAVDARSFDEFWSLDDAGLDEAIDATPWSRFRIAERQGSIAGYAVSGRAASRGYLQRLAVDPDARRGGYGQSLVADALSWMQGRGVRRALVNTHAGNHAALELYRACGFRLLPAPLRILTRTV